MAKNTQEAEVIVTMNGQAAKKAVEDLAKEYKRLQDAALAAYQAGDDALGKKLDAQAQKLKKDIQVTAVETKKFADILKNINGATLKELNGAAKQLRSEINKLTPGTQEFIEKSKQLQQVNTRIKQLQSSFKGLVEEEKQASFSLKGLADGFNKYFGMVTAGIAAITGLSMAFRKAAQDAAALDDTYSDVMKTTGLLHEQVTELDNELMKIDTRTSREQLLLLARDAGKLGIQGKENILGFVRAADQIQVALGEDLGEGAIRQLGKIADVLGYTSSMGVEKALLSIGSAINAVGQDSTASEAYLVEFTQRLAGVGAQANISAADLIGFASGLDQSAMKVEMAATAFQKFLMKMYEDPAKFSEYAKMEVQEFTDLLQNDASKAITTVLKALKEQGGFASLVPIFDEMGLDGARAVTVLSSMAANLDAVTKAQALANEEFKKATSVTDEYAVKNNNLQAQLEKARKEFQNASIALGQSLNPVLLKSTKAVTYLIKLLAEHGKEIRNAAIAVAALTALIKAQTIAEAAENAIKKVGNTLTQTGTFLTNKLAAAYYRLTGQTLKYVAAQKAANAAASKSVYGLIAIAVGTLVYKLTELNNKMEENREITEKVRSVEEKIAETYAEEKGRIEVLTKMVNNNNLSLDDRRAALLKLKEIVPGYHANLTEEGILIDNNTKAIERYLQKFKEKTRLQAYEDVYAENEKALAETELALEKKKEEKQKMIEDNGGEYPSTHVSKPNKWFTTQGTLGPFLGTYVDNQLGLTKQEVSDFGNLLNEINDLDSQVRKYKKEKKRLENKLDDLHKEDETQMQEEILDINRKYEDLEAELEKSFALTTERKLELERKRFAEIEEVRKKYESDTGAGSTENANLTKAQFDFLNERYDKLTKKEKQLIDKGYASLTNDEAKALKSRYDKLMNADKKLGDQRYQKQVSDLEKRQREEQNLINQMYLDDLNKNYSDRKITAEEHEKQLREITIKYLEEKLQLAIDNGKDTSQIEAAIYKERMANRKEDYDEALKQLQACQKDEENALAMSLAAQEITEKEYQSQMLEAKMHYLQEKLKLAHDAGQDETDILQAILDAQLEAQKAANEEMAKLKKEAKEVIAGIDPSSARKSELEEQLKQLDVLHNAKLLSEQQYREAVKQLNKKYDEEEFREKLAKVELYTEQVNGLMQQSSNFVNALKDYETQKAEADYQAQLTAAGDNAEKREQIEAEYEEKKLEIQKKYADTEMVINIAKTVAAGALAAIQAFAQLGPIGGAVAAALIAATTAMEVATIVQQRNAIKNSSVNTSSSSSSTDSSSNVNTGTRTMTGYAEGGNTKKSASDSTPVGIVHANEWVGPAWLVRKEPVLFADLEQYRKTGRPGRNGRLAKGFADGGLTSGAQVLATGNNPSLTKADIESAVEVAIVKAMDDGKLYAIVQYGDILIAAKKHENFTKTTKR